MKRDICIDESIATIINGMAEKTEVIQAVVSIILALAEGLCGLHDLSQVASAFRHFSAVEAPGLEELCNEAFINTLLLLSEGEEVVDDVYGFMLNNMNDYADYLCTMEQSLCDEEDV